MGSTWIALRAGIQAAKKTSELIPLCHPLPLTHVDVSIAIVKGGVRLESTASTMPKLKPR